MRKIKYILYLSILASSIFFMGHTIQIQDVEAQVCVPIVMISSEYSCIDSGPDNGANACNISGTHKACFLTGYKRSGNTNQRGCRVIHNGGGSWTLEAYKALGNAQRQECWAMCID